MIRFNVNGQYLELAEDFSLQFKKSNILFAFDNIECERSTSFDVPATPHNNRVFSLAKWVQTDGIGMRRKYEAQMQDGMVTQDGYLHIDMYNAGKYKAVFVTGELLGLKKIRDAGKIKDFWKPAGGIVWSVENIKDANDVLGNPFAMVRYVSNVALLHPSFDLSDVCAYAYAELTGKTFPPRLQIYRLIPKEVTGMEKTDCTLTYTGTGAELAPTAAQAALGNTLQNEGLLSAVETFDQILRVRQNTYQYIKLREWRAKQTLILTFPNNFPNDYFLMRIEDTGAADDPVDVVYSRSWFLGDYYFYQATGGGTIVPDDIPPLAGRSVTVESGWAFVLMSRSWFAYEPSPLNLNGFLYASIGNYSLTVQIEADELQDGDTVRAYDLLPDMTLTELMKIYAALEGKMLYYDENGDIQFDELDVSTWGVFDLTGKVVSVNNIARKFGNYAQKNVINFKSGSDVMPTHRVENSYTIDNDNIAEEKTLLQIGYSEGEIAERNGFIVARFDAEDTDKNTLYEQGIMTAKANSQSTYGERISVPKNAGLQALCDASTSVSIQARMTYLEFTLITPKTLLYFEGVRYVWTEANWTKNVATIKMSKIPA